MISWLFLRRHWSLCSLFALALTMLAWSALAPLHVASHERLLEVAQGTWARRMAGERAETLPSTIRLTLGVRDVLLLRNRDTVPLVFGPLLILPGHETRLPFDSAATTAVACSARLSGQLTVVVEPLPNPGLARIAWRLDELAQAIRTY